jgi:hypothetical protein
MRSQKVPNNWKEDMLIKIPQKSNLTVDIHKIKYQ